MANQPVLYTLEPLHFIPPIWQRTTAMKFLPIQKGFIPIHQSP